jgi:hypothetical protein
LTAESINPETAELTALLQRTAPKQVIAAAYVFHMAVGMA